jgi:hypothetical protein
MENLNDIEFHSTELCNICTVSIHLTISEKMSAIIKLWMESTFKVVWSLSLQRIYGCVPDATSKWLKSVRECFSV